MAVARSLSTGVVHIRMDRQVTEYLRDDSGRIICTVPIDVQSVQYVQIPHYRMLCAWCGEVLEEGAIGAPTSHGICPRCLEEEL